jgi:hypothetical protein
LLLRIGAPPVVQRGVGWRTPARGETKRGPVIREGAGVVLVISPKPGA